MVAPHMVASNYPDGGGVHNVAAHKHESCRYQFDSSIGGIDSAAFFLYSVSLSSVSAHRTDAALCT